MTFRVGQKVVLVSDFDTTDPRMLPGGYYVPFCPVKGPIYTVRTSEQGYIRLEEVINPVREFRAGKSEVKFSAMRFRPIVERKTEISFTQGADPSTDKLDNRRKVRMPA